MIKTATIKIDGKEYIVKRNFKSLLLFEEMTGNNIFSIKENLSDTLKLQYCILKANNNITFSFDEYLEYIDEDETIIIQFTNYLSSLIDNSNDINDELKKKVMKK